MRKNTSSGQTRIPQLLEIEPAKWDLNPTQRLAAAACKRDMGTRHFRKGDADVARQRYCKALDFVEFDTDFIVDSDDSDTEGIRETLPELADVHAERIRCLANLAATSLQLEDFTATITYCERVLNLQRSDARVWYRKGSAERALGRLAAARQSLVEAAKIEPKDKRIRDLLALISEERKESAKEELLNLTGVSSSKQTGGYGNTAASLQQSSDERSGEAVAASLWEKAADDRSAPTRKKVGNVDKAEAEYNKRQLMYHFEKNKTTIGDPQEDPEEHG